MTSAATRQRRRRGGALFEIIIVVAIIALVNLLSLRFFTRADLSEGKLFSVSESTRKVVRDLDDIVKLTVYLVDLADFGLVNEVMASRFSSPYPARAAVQVAALPRGARVEIDAIMRP